MAISCYHMLRVQQPDGKLICYIWCCASCKAEKACLTACQNPATQWGSASASWMQAQGLGQGQELGPQAAHHPQDHLQVLPVVVWELG